MATPTATSLLSSIQEPLAAAQKEGSLLASTVENIVRVVQSPESTGVDLASVGELVAAKEWAELNDRFFKALAFGTGGIRGRTICKKVTKAEQGSGGPDAVTAAPPEHPGTGTNVMNRANLGRAALGLGLYLRKAFPGKTSKVVIAHDTRHYSRSFAELAAEKLRYLGHDVLLFAEERSTPQLSFSVRHYKAQAGIVISASHNPPPDNGFKAYFQDGAQLVEPDASGVIAEVNALASGQLAASEIGAPQLGTLTILGPEADDDYIEALKTALVIEPEIFAKAHNLKIVYTSLHGTGIKIIPPLFDEVGLHYTVVDAQRQGDGRFPTVKSPNPEESAALALAIAQARAESADLVIATDPDDDRMGAAIRDAQGEYQVITGNMIGSILAFYRIDRLFAQGILTPANKGRAALIKTFVTTDLQKAMAEAYGIKHVETLTGFKYIGEKLRQYEQATGAKDYDALPFARRRALQLEKGTFFLFGGEESYGYSGGDYVRDKDGNAASLMLAEAAAWAKSKGQTLLDYLDAIYLRFGYYTEKLGTLTFEGAKGAAQIQALLASYRATPPVAFLGHQVIRVDDFGKQDFKDVDGNPIPKETMLIFHLSDGGRMAVRGSGTEPKIKFYFFANGKAADAPALAALKKERRAALDAWWEEVQADVKKRVEGV
ncbi:phosphoglucomutase [Verrucomicrobium sp. GAS474]|uniref:phospho-sugar mutase n=1 Tax=Verrucomicrobium sp. GAS474 TaxID=1882831 RepID=UPI00087D3AE4|nr:phospho-sugar mutase [Verrucomicrobium sp. GAS474]SDT89928.1 phosphoglucomutase [Verrucomicrobium sp. GAS474]